MSDPYFFGYGSLVNAGSHGYGPVSHAALPGWRRTWRASRLRPAAFLTAYSAPGSTIDGVLAPVPGGDWAALDLRERGYDRVMAPGITHDLGPDTQVAVYAMPPRRGDAEAGCQILLSYLDVVVKGFLDQFGEDGVARFMHSTDGWHLPMACDREAPLYPRAQDVGAQVTDLCDHWLDRLGVQRNTPDWDALSA